MSLRGSIWLFSALLLWPCPARAEPQQAEAEYRAVQHDYPDTAEGHWQLAEWCREHGLAKFRGEQLKRAIELDPDHRKARRALGYSRPTGVWKTRDELMTERGYIKQQGRWVSPQEALLQERQNRQAAAEKEWLAKLKRWRSWLDASRADEALREFRAIEDPAAIRGLKRLLANETVKEHRRLYVDVLAGIDDPEARQVLLDRSLEDPQRAVRIACLEHLSVQPQPALLSYYVDKLRSKDNAVVNRAAAALARLEDSAAMGPLIDALVTSHYVPEGTDDSDDDGRALRDVDAGESSRPIPANAILVKRSVKNPEVRRALVSLSDGANFGFDVKAWKAWLARQKKPAAVNTRRD